MNNNRISNERAAHMHTVAELMYTLSEKFDDIPKDTAYLVGYLHDIGYMAKPEMHEAESAKLLYFLPQYLLNIISSHGKTPNQYMEENNCGLEGIPDLLILLWYADMSVLPNGNMTTFDERLKDIKERHGIDSVKYKHSFETITWLKENSFLCK